jgi:ParB/RepB/Spo0J family partition protein
LATPRAEGEPRASRDQIPATDYKRPSEVNIDNAVGQPYVIYEGLTLDTVLMNRLDGDAVGPVKVLVSNPVYSHDHQHVLIPEGTIVLGEARKIGSAGFEIVAGARRYRAAQIAEAATVPVRIVNLTDAEAIEAALIENLQRCDVHPLEEAQGFHALLNLEEPKYTVEQIGAKVGKAPASIATRARLTELVPAVVEAFYAGRSVLDTPCCWQSSNQPNRKPLSQAAFARIGAGQQGRPSASSFPSGISSIG